MATIIAEQDITLEVLSFLLHAAGLEPESLNDKQIRLRTDAGIGFRITILDDKPFLHFGTYLPLDRNNALEEKLAFVYRLNADLFLPQCCLDDGGDLLVRYVLPYQCALVGSQFVTIAERFGSLLNHIVHSVDTEGLIDFGPPVGTDEQSSEPPVRFVRSDGTLLN
jgi:hypothetical protein